MNIPTTRESSPFPPDDPFGNKFARKILKKFREQNTPIKYDPEPIELLIDPLVEKASENPSGPSFRLLVKIGAAIALELMETTGLSDTDERAIKLVLGWIESGKEIPALRVLLKNMEADRRYYPDQMDESEWEIAARNTRYFVRSLVEAVCYYPSRDTPEKRKDALDSLYLAIVDMSAAALIHAEIASGSEKNGYDLRKKFAPAIYEIALEAIQEESEDS